MQFPPRRHGLTKAVALRSFLTCVLVLSPRFAPLQLSMDPVVLTSLENNDCELPRDLPSQVLLLKAAVPGYDFVFQFHPQRPQEDALLLFQLLEGALSLRCSLILSRT